MGYKRLSKIQLVLLGVVGFLILVLGIYHFTHHGMNSGKLELTSFLVLMLALFLPDPLKRKSYHRLSPLQIVLISFIDFWAIFFSIYHFTHNGTPSDILELSAFILLALVIFLPFKLPEQSKRG